MLKDWSGVSPPRCARTGFKEADVQIVLLEDTSGDGVHSAAVKAPRRLR